MPTQDAPDFMPPLVNVARQQRVEVSNAVDLTINLATYVSATVPSAPVDGQVWVYEDTTNHIRWWFAYRLADTYWYSIGPGAALFAEVVTNETTVSTTYAALATAGPAIALPFAGDYDVAIGFSGTTSVAGDGGAMSYDIGGTGAVDADRALMFGATTDAISEARPRRKTGLTAVTLTAKYKALTGGTAAFQHRWMSVLPVRVSG